MVIKVSQNEAGVFGEAGGHDDGVFGRDGHHISQGDTFEEVGEIAITAINAIRRDPLDG